MSDDVLSRRAGQVGSSSQPPTWRAHAKNDYIRFAFLTKSKNLIGHRTKLDRIVGINSKFRIDRDQFLRLAQRELSTGFEIDRALSSPVQYMQHSQMGIVVLDKRHGMGQGCKGFVAEIGGKNDATEFFALRSRGT